MAASPSHWERYRARWASLGPPLRPPPAVVKAMREALTGHSGPTLLYGVTPELADIAPDLLALDRSQEMLLGVWPGDHAQRRALRGDWLTFDQFPHRFLAAVGDGALNVLPSLSVQRALLRRLAAHLSPGGRAVFRVFLRPDLAEPLPQVIGTPELSLTFHGYKWRVAMALAAEAPEVPVQRLYDTLTAPSVASRLRSHFPEADLDTLKVYRGSTETYCFPTRKELEAVVPAAFELSWLDVLDYELAERCPLLVLDLREAAG